MEKRRLRNIEVSPIGIGCMGFSHGHRGFSEQQGNSMANWGKK